MTSWRQVGALVALRWTMVRSMAVRVGLLAALASVPLLAALVILSRSSTDPDALTAVLDAAPAAFVGFGVLAVIAPLTSGGSELVPADQLVAYPVRPSTMFLSSLVLAPLNLVWVVQLLVLTAETGFLTIHQPHLVLGGITSLVFVAACTCVGQALAWLVAGLRQSRPGLIAMRSALVLGGALAILVVRTGHGRDVVDHSFGPRVTRAVAAGGRGDAAGWVPTTGGLLIVVLLALLLGARACHWALRRPVDAGAARTSRQVHRRALPSSPYQALLATDRASVWRAPALRRGALVLAVMPGVAAAGVGLPWRSLVFLPALVAAGGGLLFGFNAFCLDSSGATWLASLPHPPSLVARAKARVTAEIVFAAAALAAVVGSVRAVRLPRASEVSAILSSVVGCSILVVALCVSMSVRKPYRADLNGPRDAVAPPGSLVLTSIRLTMPAALVGAVLETAAISRHWWLPVVLTLPLVAYSLRSISRSLAQYDDPVLRSRIVQVVSSG